jgi:SAM-dependent MidA family methyltransferase
MLHVGEKDGKLAEVFLPITPAVDEYVDRYAVRPEAGERVEAGLAAFQEMRKIAEGVEQGFIVFIDYGYAREELLAGRHRGTVMAYRRHSASPNPYEASGEQDITAHVNFTAIAAAAEKVGLQTERLLTQSQFLMGIGESNQFADAFEECKLPQERAKVMLQLKHLVTPVGMGEMFHVLVGSKGVHAADIEKLSGLRFARR